MLPMLLTAVVLSGLAIYGMARLSRKVMGHFDLDLMSVLLWLGLAEWPSEPAPRRPIIDI